MRIPFAQKLNELVRSHTEPRRLGLAVGLGVFIGSSPFFGLHLLVCVAVATLFRLNVVAVTLGGQISIPALAPLLVFAEAQLGARLVRGQWMGLGLAAFRSEPAVKMARDFFVFVLCGWVPIGITLGILLGTVVWGLARARA